MKLKASYDTCTCYRYCSTGTCTVRTLNPPPHNLSPSITSPFPNIWCTLPSRTVQENNNTNDLLSILHRQIDQNSMLLRPVHVPIALAPRVDSTVTGEFNGQTGVVAIHPQHRPLQQFLHPILVQTESGGRENRKKNRKEHRREY